MNDGKEIAVLPTENLAGKNDINQMVQLYLKNWQNLIAEQKLGLLAVEANEDCEKESHNFKKPTYFGKFPQIQSEFLTDVTVTMEEIPPKLILNWDQTEINLALG